MTVKNKISFLKNITIGISLVVIFFSCENNLKEVGKITSYTNIDNRVEDMDMIYTDSGVVKLRLKAPVTINHKDKEEPYKEFPDGIEIFFYKDRDTIIKGYLKGNYAINYENKHLSEVRGNVIVINDKGDTLNTEKLFWDSKDKKIYSDELVRISQQEQVIIGKNGFEADEDFSYYSIKNSSGDISIDNDDKEKDINDTLSENIE